MYNLAFAINRPYLIWSMVSIISCLKNNPNHLITFHIVNDGSISEADIDLYLSKIYEFKKFSNFKINIVNISNHRMYDRINTSINKWTKEVNFKILFPSLFPSLDKILYIDADTLIIGDIKKLFDINMNQKIIIGDLLVGLNGGCVLFNLDECRKLNFQDIILNELKNSHITEERAIDIHFLDKIINVPQHIYNISKKRDVKKLKFNLLEVVIVHFVARDPWVSSTSRKLNLKFNKEWFKYLEYFIDNKNKLNFFHTKNLCSLFS